MTFAIELGLRQQIDMQNKQLDNLRHQADALHRVGQALSLPAGTDLAKEAPQAVATLITHRDNLIQAMHVAEEVLQSVCFLANAREALAKIEAAIAEVEGRP